MVINSVGDRHMNPSKPDHKFQLICCKDTIEEYEDYFLEPLTVFNDDLT